MKLKRSKEWWLAKADAEGDVVVAAGALALDFAPELESSSSRRRGKSDAEKDVLV